MFLKMFKKYKSLKKRNRLKIGRLEITDMRSLIGVLNKKLQTTEQELAKYINKFLINEEKWKIIYAFTNKINSTIQLKPIFEAINYNIRRLVDTNFVALALFDGEQDKLFVEDYIEEVRSKEDLISGTKKIEDLQQFLEEQNALFVEAKRQNHLVNSDVAKFYTKNIKNKFHFEILETPEEFLGLLIFSTEKFSLTNEEIGIIKIIAKNASMAVQRSNLYMKLKDNNRYKREFIASMSHEFKTPLNSIIGFSQILRENKDLDDSGKEYLENILMSSRHLLNLVEDILDVSKADSNKIELFYQKFNTKQIIKEITSTVQIMLLDKNIQITSHLIDVQINADIKRFRQIIYNLLNNAIKFNSQNGKITIITYIENGYFNFEIEDTGEGMNPKDMHKIFKFFSQVNANYKKRQEGSGIGLALCKKIVELHGGNIGFESEENVGSKFWFCLPTG